MDYTISYENDYLLKMQISENSKIIDQFLKELKDFDINSTSEKATA